MLHRVRPKFGYVPSSIQSALFRHHPPLVLDNPVLMTPVGDVLLTDVTWDNLKEVFPKTHKPVGSDPIEPILCLSATNRTLALLPVTRTYLRVKYGPHYVPFLLDTGSPQTFFTTHTIAQLELQKSDRIEVLSKPVIFRQSSGHFDDINLLGMDFLISTKLVLDYPGRVLTLETTQVSSSTWVQLYDGASPIGSAFEVTPTKNHIDGLKKAVKAEMPHALKDVDAATLIVKAQDNDKELDPDTPLAANTVKTAYRVEVRKTQ